MNPTYTINGSTYEPLTDYLRGWVPGVLGLPCPLPATEDTCRGHLLGTADRKAHGLGHACISNVLWHSIRQGTCRKIEPCA